MSFFACCFRRHNRRRDESMQVLHEPPEISWENTLGAPNGVPFDDETKELLRLCLDSKMPAPTTLTEIIKRSEGFPVPFPVSSVRSFALRDRSIGMDTLEFNANSAYPLIHEATLPLIANWLKHKRVYGSSIERALYKDMGLIQFIQRLLEKRAIQFYGPDDRYTLVNGKIGAGGWENVGTEREKEPLVLASCLSYDEIKLSATIIVSSHTEFINDGSRENRGVVTDDPDSIQPRGVVMGVVGTRFEKPRVMEYQDILITNMQNNMDNGYGPPGEGGSEEKRGLRCVWARFYGEDHHPLYDEAVRRAKLKDNKRYVPLTGQIIFDAENYMKRTLMSVEMILLEANTRAEKQNTTAFLHVVGFGLGVWKIIYDQEVYFLKTFEIALRKMNKKLRYVSDIMFSYFRQQRCGGAGNGDYLGDIRIHFALREPQTKLFRSSDANKLLIVTYAADGNSYPGNEFWGNYLTASGEPAAACSSQIAELHNPRINPRASGASLHVASPEHGIVHIGDYAKLHLTCQCTNIREHASQGQVSPVGTDQQQLELQQQQSARRPSRSPRSQRSRSADIDCLKKYMERKVEHRRHTEAGETSRWIPFSRGSMQVTALPTKDQAPAPCARPLHAARASVAAADPAKYNEVGNGYYNPLSAERVSPRRRTLDLQDIPETKDKVRPLPVLTRYRSSEYASSDSGDEAAATGVARSRQARSHSADVTNYPRRDSLSRYNERYVNFSERGRLINYRLMSDAGVSLPSRYVPSPLARRISDGSAPVVVQGITESGLPSTRWMTYARHPSPSPIQRNPSYRRASEQQQSLLVLRRQDSRDNSEAAKKRDELAGWQPIRKFAPTAQASTETGPTATTTAAAPSAAGDTTASKPDAPANLGSPEKTEPKTTQTLGNAADGDQDAPDVNRVKQRLRELYDFKIETEWPKRVRKPSRDTLWISKSSSEEEKSQQQSSSSSSQQSQPQQQQQQPQQQQQQQSSTEKSQQQKPEVRASPVRRNSQDLEFNDRTIGQKSLGSLEQVRQPRQPQQQPQQQQSSHQPQQQMHQCSNVAGTTVVQRKLPELPASSRRSGESSSVEQVFEPASSEERKLQQRRLLDRLRFSEELPPPPPPPPPAAGSGEPDGRGGQRARRTYSDDYENPSRRKLSDGLLPDGKPRRESKRHSADANLVKPRSAARALPQAPPPPLQPPSYAEAEAAAAAAHWAARSAPYHHQPATMLLHEEPRPGRLLVHQPLGKRSSLEYRSNSGGGGGGSGKRLELQPHHRRAMSQYEPRARSSGSTVPGAGGPGRLEPRPLAEIEEQLYRDYKPPGKSLGFASRPRRNSTRYKVYLT